MKALYYRGHFFIPDLNLILRIVCIFVKQTILKQNLFKIIYLHHLKFIIYFFIYNHTFPHNSFYNQFFMNWNK